MTTTNMDVEDVLSVGVRAIVRNLLNLPDNSVRPYKQGTPGQPVGAAPFATVLITEIHTVGLDQVKLANIANNHVQETITGPRLLTASIQFYRSGAYQNAARLVALLQASIVAGWLGSAGWGFVRTSGVRNLSGLVDTFWEDRAQLDVTFSCLSIETIDYRTFGTFPITTDDSTNRVTVDVVDPHV